MIDGVHPQKIPVNDHYRRFVVLQILIRRALLVGGEQKDRYQAVNQDMLKLEELVAFKNTNNAAKASDALARMTQLNDKLGEVIPRVQASKSMFEGELLKRWRDTLNVKKKKEEQLQKQKEEKSTSNKNLMYLSAEILKKERLSAHNLKDHQERISQAQQKIEQAIAESTTDFLTKHKELRRVIEAQKDKVARTIQQQDRQMQAEQQKFIETIKQTEKRLQQRLHQQQQASLRNASDIKQLLLQCQRRRQG